jgi:hypothetical protein
MTLAFAFLLGLLCSRWLETMLTRVALRVPWPAAQTTVRNAARSRGIETREKGKIISLASLDAKEAVARGGRLEEIIDSYERSEGGDLPEG